MLPVRERVGVGERGRAKEVYEKVNIREREGGERARKPSCDAKEAL